MLEIIGYIILVWSTIMIMATFLYISLEIYAIIRSKRDMIEESVRVRITSAFILLGINLVLWGLIWTEMMR